MSARPAFADLATSRPRTLFAGGINIFTGEPMPAAASAAPKAHDPFRAAGDYTAGKSGPKKGHKNMPRIDITTLKIRSDVPLPGARRILGKYAKFFDQLQPKQMIECKPDEVNPIDQALRKFLRERGLDKDLTVVRAQYLDEDPNKGGVWLWPKSEIEQATAKANLGGRALAEKRSAKK